MDLTLKQYQIKRAEELKSALLDLKETTGGIKQYVDKLNGIRTQYKLFLNSTQLQPFNIGEQRVNTQILRENDTCLEIKAGRFIFLISKKSNRVIRSNIYDHLFINKLKNEAVDYCMYYQEIKPCDVCGELYKGMALLEPSEVIKASNFILLCHSQCVSLL